MIIEETPDFWDEKDPSQSKRILIGKIVTYLHGIRHRNIAPQWKKCEKWMLIAEGMEINGIEKFRKLLDEKQACRERQFTEEKIFGGKIKSGSLEALRYLDTGEPIVEWHKRYMDRKNLVRLMRRICFGGNGTECACCGAELEMEEAGEGTLPILYCSWCQVKWRPFMEIPSMCWSNIKSCVDKLSLIVYILRHEPERNYVVDILSWINLMGQRNWKKHLLKVFIKDLFETRMFHSEYEKKRDVTVMLPGERIENSWVVLRGIHQQKQQEWDAELTKALGGKR